MRALPGAPLRGAEAEADEGMALKRARLREEVSSQPSPARAGAGRSPSKAGQVDRPRFLLDHVLLRAGPRAFLFGQLLKRKTQEGTFESHGLSFSSEDVEEALRLLGGQASGGQASGPPATGSPPAAPRAPSPPACVVGAAPAEDPFPQLPGPLGGIIRALVDGPLRAGPAGGVELPLRSVSGRCVTAELHDDWQEELVESPWLLRQGDTVHLVGDFAAGQDRVVLRGRGEAATTSLLIAHPDLLLTGTTVAATNECRRKAAINDEFGDAGMQRPAYLGSCVHDVIQACIAAQDFGREHAEKAVAGVLARARLQLWALGAQEDQFQWDLRGHVEAARQWAQAHFEPCRAPPAPGARPLAGGAGWQVTRMVAAEQSVTSPRFGVRGKIDGVVLARPPAGTVGDDGGERVVALELKSGSMQAEHLGQVAVYRLLVGDLYSESRCADGAMLLYTKTGAFNFHSIHMQILRGVLRNRNHLAAVLQRRRDAGTAEGLEGPEGPEGPEPAAPHWPAPLRQASICGRCFSRNACAVAHAGVEGGSTDSFGAPEVFRESGAEAMSPARRAYMARWVKMIDAEAALMVEEQARPWVQDRAARLCKDSEGAAREAESGGMRRSLGRLRLLRRPASKEVAAGGLGAIPTWIKNGTSADPTVCWEFARAGGIPAGSIHVGDPVSVSRTGGPFSIAIGVVEEVTVEHVRVRAKAESPSVLQSEKGRAMVRSQLVDIEDLGGGACASTAGAGDGHVYRLDIDAYGGGWRGIRGSLSRLVSSKEYQKVAELVVDLRRPRFQEGSALGRVPPHVAQRLQRLNDGQRAAVDAAARAEDFAIIAGYPGTGKTETVVALLDTLVSLGKKVLLCAHTNTAVDNVLLRLRREVPDLPFARCGSLAQVHPDLHDATVTWGNSRWSSVADVGDFVGRHRLVACTTTGASNELLASTQSFDAVVIEEASQATECSVWGPLLRCAGHFVLVGDLMQLPPLVRATKAKEQGMGVSLLERLSVAHPSAVVELTLQYRMCPDVVAIANTLFYQGRLRSSETAARGRLDLSLDTGKLAAWALEALRPESGVALVDTDGVGPASREAKRGGAVENGFEARVCARLVQAVLRGGLAASEVLLMAPYRRQIVLLEAALRELGGSAGDVEVLTVDRAQGRSARCVIFSAVRSSSPGGEVGELLVDWRRVNVAMTRARHKLLIVGSGGTLAGRGDEAGEGRAKLRELVGLCRSRGWVVPAPPEAGA